MSSAGAFPAWARLVRAELAKNRILLAALIATATGVTLLMTLNPASGTDYRVYWTAGHEMVTGVNIYADGPGEMPFTYTPFAALVLLPAILTSQGAGFCLWNIVAVLCLAFVVSRFVPVTAVRPARRPLLIYGLTVGCLVTFVGYHHLFWGCIDFMLLALCVADFRSGTSRFSRRVPPGIFIGIAAAIKLTPAIFIVFFALTKQWRRMWVSTAAFAAAGLFAFMVLPKFSVDFVTVVSWDLVNRVTLGDLFASTGNCSVQGAIAALGWPKPAGSAAALAVGAAGLLCAWLAWRKPDTGVGRYGTASPHAVTGLLVMLTAPLVSPVSWAHHWVILLPAVLFLWFRARPGDRLCAGICTALLVLTPGPWAGSWLLNLEYVMLWPFGVVLREMVILMGIALIARITWPAARPAAPAEGPSARAAGREQLLTS